MGISLPLSSHHRLLPQSHGHPGPGPLELAAQFLQSILLLLQGQCLFLRPQQLQGPQKLQQLQQEVGMEEEAGGRRHTLATCGD